MYVKYFDEEDAARALAALAGRFFGGVAIVAEYSPVTEFREGRCRQHDCGRGGLCNFMHLKLPTREFVEDLWTHQPHRGRSIGGRRAPPYPEACCAGGAVGGRRGGGGLDFRDGPPRDFRDYRGPPRDGRMMGGGGGGFGGGGGGPRDFRGGDRRW